MSTENSIPKSDETELSDKALGYLIEVTRETLQHYKDKTSEFEDRLSELNAERDRRELEAYWQRHPELTPVHVGDHVQDGSVRQLFVARLELDNETCDLRFYWQDEYNPRYVVDVPIVQVSKMRRTWLEANVTDETGGANR